MLRDIFKEISKKNSPYYDTYYLTDTEIKFSINDDRIFRVITCSLRIENGKYIAYGFEKSQINNSFINRNDVKEIKTLNEFWSWYSSFYNNLH